MLGIFLVQNRTSFLPRANTIQENLSTPPPFPPPTSGTTPDPSGKPPSSPNPQENVKQPMFEGEITMSLPDGATELLNKAGFKVDISKLSQNKSIRISVSARPLGSHEITKVELFVLCSKDNLSNTQVYCKQSKYLTWFQIPLCGENAGICQQTVNQDYRFTVEEAGMYTFAIKITGNLIEEKFDRNGKPIDRTIVGTDYCSGQFPPSETEASCGSGSKSVLLVTDNAATITNDSSTETN